MTVWTLLIIYDPISNAGLQGSISNVISNKETSAEASKLFEYREIMFQHSDVFMIFQVEIFSHTMVF